MTHRDEDEEIIDTALDTLAWQRREIDRLTAEVAQAAKAERDRIVAWLRKQEDIGFDRMLRADAPNSKRNYAAGAEAVKRCADLIKAGEHLK
jgi:hypothetical protein